MHRGSVGASTVPTALRRVVAALLAAFAASVAAAQDFSFYPDWQTYSLMEALIWTRDNEASHQPLVVTSPDQVPLLWADDLAFPFSGGVRTFVGRRAPEIGGWELGYFGVYGQSASAFVAGDPPATYIQMPEPLGSIYSVEGESATVTYTSVVNSVEANVFRTRTDWRDHTGSWLTVNWLAGFRYVGVEDESQLVVDGCVPLLTPSERAVYGVRARNNMFGAQVGNRSRWTWRNWAVEGWAKAGLLGNCVEQIQDPTVTEIFPERVGGANGSSLGFIGDLNLTVVYRLTDVWGVRLGYNTVWITGLALAADQYDFSFDEGAGGRLDTSGAMFLHGANVGLEARW